MFCRSPKARDAGFRRLGGGAAVAMREWFPAGPAPAHWGGSLRPPCGLAKIFFGNPSLLLAFSGSDPLFFRGGVFVPPAVPISINLSANEKVRKHRNRHRGLGHNSGVWTLLAEKMGRGCGIFLFISSRFFDNASRGVLHMDLRNLLYCARDSGKSACAVAPRSSSAAVRARSALLFCCRGRIIDIVFFLWNFRTAHRS